VVDSGTYCNENRTIKRDGPRLIFWCGADKDKELKGRKEKSTLAEEGHGYVHFHIAILLVITFASIGLHLHYSYAFTLNLTHPRHHIIMPCPCRQFAIRPL
jgi:hypothetical protein